MNREAFKYSIEEIEGHYGKKFAPTVESRRKLLEKAFSEMRGCSDASILRASESLLMRMSFLPSLQGLIDEVKKEHLKDAKKDDDAQEKRAGSYEKYGDTKPLTANMKNVIKYMTTGNPTRREWNETIQALYREEKTHDLLGPTAYALLCERQGLDMDKPAFRGGMVMTLGDEPEPF